MESGVHRLMHPEILTGSLWTAAATIHSRPSSVMKRRGFIAGAVVTAVAAGCRTNAPQPMLRVLTYNLHHGEGLDGRLDLPRLARVIRDSGADLVALQELDQGAQRTGRVDQSAELIRLTGLHGEFGAAMPFQGGFYGQALLSRWPLQNFVTHRLPNPSNREPRIAVSAEVQPPGLPVMRFIGTHLDAEHEDGDRFDQAGALLGRFTGANPTILAGDFNASPDSRVLRCFSDTWLDAAVHNPQPTVPAAAPRTRIDYILLRPPTRWRVRSVRVLDESVASDHRPLLAELAWEAE